MTGALEVRVQLPALRGLGDEDRDAITAWLERALRKRFDDDGIDVKRIDETLELVALYRPGLTVGALTAAAGVLDLAEQAIDLALIEIRPARARRALERRLAALDRATVTVTPKGP